MSIDSPLIGLFKESTGLTAQELRAYRRIDCKIPVLLHLENGVVEPGTLLDLSPDGAKLKTAEHVMLPENFELEGLSQQGKLSVSKAWERGGFIGLQINDNWQKLLWHETELEDILRTAKILND